jgi:hypothetical protein
MKKGQATFVEFFITYGWLVLLGIFSVSYFTFFNVLVPENMIPSTCLVGSSFSCEEYTFNTYGDKSGPAFEGIPLISLKLRNNLGRSISHAYVVMDPEDSNCGGFFGFLASPGLLVPLKPGESRPVRFYLLNYLCKSDAECVAAGHGYNTCLPFSNLCIEDRGTCSTMGTSQVCDYVPCQDCTTLPCKNKKGCTCYDLGTGGGERCYERPPFATYPYLACECVDESYNCCDSAFSRGADADLPAWAQVGLAGGDGFCSGYTISGDGVCPIGTRMTNTNKINIKFYVYYRFADSSIFHKDWGYLKASKSAVLDQI